MSEQPELFPEDTAPALPDPVLALEHVRVLTAKNPQGAGVVHVFPTLYVRRPLCAMRIHREWAFSWATPKVRRMKPLGAVTCEACRRELARQFAMTLELLTYGQNFVTDLPTDFLIEAEEAEGAGLRWSNLVLGRLAEVDAWIKEVFAQGGANRDSQTE